MTKINYKSELADIEMQSPPSWIRLTYQQLKTEQLKNAKYQEYNSHGVYIIKVNKNIRHFIGESKVVYIGSSKTVINRLQNLFNFLYSDKDNYVHTAKNSLRRIDKETGLKLEVLFKNYTEQEYKIVESNLIQNFMKIHIEKPPVNCNRK